MSVQRCIELYERCHDFGTATLLDFRDGALLLGVIPNLNICTNLALSRLSVSHELSCHLSNMSDLG